MKRILTLAIAVATWLAASATTPSLLRATDSAAMERWVDSVMSTLSPEQRVAQLMMVAVTPKGDAATNAIIDRMATSLQVGGVIYHESTIAAQVAATNRLRAAARVPMLVAIDGEWGVAMRLHELKPFAKNLRLGAINDEKLLYAYGRETARQCRLLGIHVDFAPVVDVNDTPEKPTLDNRSFGESPEAVAAHAAAYARGLEDGGVLSVSKHFPGHGATSDDSHKMLPTIKKSMRELNTCELVPFRRYFDAGLGGVMVAHLNVPAIDKDVAPTTFSRRCVTDLLQGELNFEGLIFTDALGMHGAADAVPAGGSAAVEALVAGNDVLLMPEQVEQDIKAVMAAIAAGRVTQEQVDASCRKQLRFKYALGLTRDTAPIDTTNLKQRLQTPETLALQDELVAASITIAKNSKNMLPVSHFERQKIAVVTIGRRSPAVSSRVSDYARVDLTLHVRDDESLQAATAALKSGGFTTVIAVATDDEAATRALARGLTSRVKNVALVITATPYNIRHYGSALHDARALVLTYDAAPTTVDLAVQTIFAGNAARGTLPVTVRPVGGGKTLRVGAGTHYAATRLGFASPASVGFDNRLLHQIDSVARYGIEQGAFPGCQVLVARHGKVVVNGAWGRHAADASTPVTTGSIYDLASVSKATGTISAVMKVFDNGGFALDDEASKYIPGLQRPDKRHITFRELLLHETGMPPSLSMWEMMMDTTSYSGRLITGQRDANHNIKVMNGAWGNDRARLRRDILSPVPTADFPTAIARDLYGGQATYRAVMDGIYNVKLLEKRYRYSCLNFSLLADAMQRISGERLDNFDRKNFFAPLGMWRTCYRAADHFPLSQIVPTEVDTYLRRQHVHGYVHDELSAFSLGVQGNAGLFSPAVDLAKLLQMWLNGGTYGGDRFLSEATVKVFTTEKSLTSHRGLGFDKPVIGNPDAGNTCAEAGPSVYGHTGFTGTSFWVDPDNDMIYIFMSNRVCPTRDNRAFGRVSARSNIHSIIYQNLKK